MPPRGNRLTAAQVQLLRDWIAGGADWPAAGTHWAYVPLKRPAVPPFRDPKESRDLLATEPKRAEAMKKELTAWLESVVRSLNGEDYPAK